MFPIVAVDLVIVLGMFLSVHLMGVSWILMGGGLLDMGYKTKNGICFEEMWVVLEIVVMKKMDFALRICDW